MGERSSDPERSPQRWRWVAVGALASVALVAGLLAWVGPGAVLATLAGASPGPVVLGVAATGGSLACRHAAYRTLYRSTGAGPGGPRFHLLILFAGLPRVLFPAGYVGGPAINGLYLKRGIGARFGPTVAALAVVEFLASVASVVVAVVGIGLLAATGSPVPGSTVVVATVLVGVGLSALGLGVVAVHSKRFARTVERFWTVLRTTVDRVPTTSRLRRFAGDRVSRPVGAFAGDLRTVATNRRGVYAVVVLTGTGWFVGASTLYFSLWAVGAPAPIAVAMVAVPLSALAGLAPVPGGVGTTEVTLTGIVVGLTTTPADVAAAAVLLFRLSTIGVELGTGGVAGAVLAAMGRRPGAV